MDGNHPEFQALAVYTRPTLNLNPCFILHGLPLRWVDQPQTSFLNFVWGVGPSGDFSHRMAPQQMYMTHAQGIGIEEILEAVVHRIPPPPNRSSEPLRALIFDSYYDSYKARSTHGLAARAYGRFGAAQAEHQCWWPAYFPRIRAAFGSTWRVRNVSTFLPAQLAPAGRIIGNNAPLRAAQWHLWPSSSELLAFACRG